MAGKITVVKWFISLLHPEKSKERKKVYNLFLSTSSSFSPCRTKFVETSARLISYPLVRSITLISSPDFPALYAASANASARLFNCMLWPGSTKWSSLLVTVAEVPVPIAAEAPVWEFWTDWVLPWVVVLLPACWSIFSTRPLSRRHRSIVATLRLGKK